MKKIVFISDFYVHDLNGGGESNDFNLIKFLGVNHDVHGYKSNHVSIDNLKEADTIIVSNFVLLPDPVKQFLIDHCSYIIYEHDHKYVKTRDPSKFKDFVIPEPSLVNQKFYENSKKTVVLSKICKDVLNKNLPRVDVANIGCSLWSEEKFKLLKQLCKTPKQDKVCIMQSNNPTKNFPQTLDFCKRNKINCEPITSPDPLQFLTLMSQYKTFLFIPSVLETFSRICAEAKMMNLEVMTNKKMIGFFSEESSSLQGLELIEKMEEKNNEAFAMFAGLM